MLALFTAKEVERCDGQTGALESRIQKPGTSQV
jgi:hypothetical protein